MLKKILVILIVLAVSACLNRIDPTLFVRSTSGSGDFIVADVRVFNGFSFIDNQDVWVERGKIKAIGSSLAIADDISRVDGSGKTLVPGFIDAHVHLISAGAPPWLPSMGNIERTLSANLAVGITSVIDMGAPLKDIAQWQNKTGLLLPQYAYAGRMHNRRYGHPASAIDNSLSWPMSAIVKRMMIGEIEDDVDIQQSVLSHVEHGASMIKVAIDEIPLDTPKLTPELLKSLVVTAHKNGLPVVAHIGTEEEMSMGIDAEIDLFVHGPYRSSLSAETIVRLKDLGAPVVMTAVVFEQIASFNDGSTQYTPLEKRLMDPKIMQAYQNPPESFDVDPATLRWVAQNEEFRHEKYQSLKKMLDAGVNVWIGSDSPNLNNVAGAAYHKEMLLWHEKAGIDAGRILAAATGNQSLWLEKHLGWKVGQIREGYDANLLLIDGDVERDIELLSEPEIIWIKGQRVERQEWQ